MIYIYQKAIYNPCTDCKFDLSIIKTWDPNENGGNTKGDKFKEESFN